MHASASCAPVELPLGVDVPDGGQGPRHVAHLSSSMSKDDTDGAEDLCSHARLNSCD